MYHTYFHYVFSGWQPSILQVWVPCHVVLQVKKNLNNILICCCCFAADICSPVHVSWCWFPRECGAPYLYLSLSISLSISIRECGAPYLFLNALLHPSIRWRSQEFRLQWGGKAEPVVKVEEKQDIFLGQEVHAIKLVRENKLDFMSSRSISSWGCD